MSKSVVVFYSWAGHTRKMAETICIQTGVEGKVGQTEILQSCVLVQKYLICLLSMRAAVTRN